jgi:hypothetical protein
VACPALAAALGAYTRQKKKTPDTGTIIDEPVLLLLDQHSSHLSAEALELAAANGIVVFGLVPHASHILQPLDVACFRPWHTNYGAALRAARNAEPTLVVTKDVFPKLMRKPWADALSATNAINGFAATGLFPLNPERVLARFVTGAKTPHDAVRPPAAGSAPAASQPSPTGPASSQLSTFGPSPTGDETWDENTPPTVVLAELRRYQAALRRERVRRILTPPPAPGIRPKQSRAGALRGQRAYTGDEMLQHIRDAEEVKAQAAAAKAAAQAQRQAAREQKRAQNEAKRAASQSRTRPSLDADTIMIDAEP